MGVRLQEYFTAPSTPPSGKTEIYGDTSGRLAQIDDAGAIKIIAVQPQFSVTTAATPGQQTKVQEAAMGIAAPLTPSRTGRVMVIVAGLAGNTVIGAGEPVNITLRFGTGTAPVNMATTGLGSIAGLLQHVIASTAAGQQGFCIPTVITGLTLGTAYWFDLTLGAMATGNPFLKDVTILVMEF